VSLSASDKSQMSNLNFDRVSDLKGDCA
jgi:hypothetical protein